MCARHWETVMHSFLINSFLSRQFLKLMRRSVALPIAVLSLSSLIACSRQTKQESAPEARAAAPISVQANAVGQVSQTLQGAPCSNDTQCDECEFCLDAPGPGPGLCVAKFNNESCSAFGCQTGAHCSEGKCV